MPANITDLTLRIKADTSGIKVIGAESKKLGNELDRTGKKGVSTFSRFSKNLDGIQKRIGGLIVSTAKWGAVITAAFGAITFGLILRDAIRFNSALETSRLGIAAILASTQDFTDVFGRTIDGAERFSAALLEAESIQRRLQIINLETSATTEEILLAFQGIAAPAAAANFTIDQTLQTTKLLVQSTKALGLESNQIVQESRDLLSATIDRNSQLALALGITSEQLKQAREQGRLFEFLNERLAEFARAGELTQTTFEGITSNLKDAISVASGQVFQGTFDQIKRIGAELIGAITNVTDETIEINPAVVQVGEAIDREIVGLLEIAEERGREFIESLDPQDIEDGLRNTRLYIADILDAIGGALQTFGSIPEVAQFGILGFLLFGGRGAVILPVLATFSEELEGIVSALNNPEAATFNALERKIELVKGQIRELQDELQSALDAGVDTTQIDNINKQIDDALETLTRLVIQRDELVVSVGEEAVQQEEVNSLMGQAGGLLVGIADSLRDVDTSLQNSATFSQDLANNSFLAFFGFSSVLGSVNEIEERLKALRNLGAQITPGDDDDDSDDDEAAKKAARERERIAERLQRDIERITLAREEFERREIARTVEEAKKAGVDATLIKEFQAAKELELEREKFEEFKKLLDERTEEQIKRNEEVLAAFSEVQLANLPESARLGIQFEEELDAIQKALDLFLISEEEALAERVKTWERYNEQITEVERAEYIQRLKDSDSFFDNLKGGFLDFVDQVENNSELISQFFANTLTEMSQNFSDLFFNVLTGKFDSLVDVAEQAFKAILRSFLDLVAAIATRQIVISIGGAFNLGAGGGGGNLLGAGGSGLLSGITGLGGFLGLGSSGLFGASGTFTALGNVFGLAGGGIGGAAGLGASLLGAIPALGIIAGIAAIAIPIISGLFKKSPRFAFKFEDVQTAIDERAASVNEFLDADFFKSEIFQKLVGRGGGGAFSGKEVEEIAEAVQKAIAGTIQSVQSIINQLPDDVAALLNETLLNTVVDAESRVGRSNLLGFDAKGRKKIKERLEKFFQGEVQARFLESIRGFFEFAFVQLGALPDAASSFIDEQFEAFKSADQEGRIQIGQDLLESFQAFVGAFNIISGNGTDSISAAVNQVENLSRELGFDAIPSLEELRLELERVVESADIDPETVQAFIDLRAAIISLRAEILSSISSIIGSIQSLNATIVSFGGAAVDVTGFLNTAVGNIQNILNQGGLSLGEREALLGELSGFANQLLAEEQAAFQQAQAAQQRANEARRASLQSRIEGLQEEKQRIQDVFRTRLDALNEELRIAQDFARLTESIRATLDSILFSPESVLTGVEQVNALQTRIANLQSELSQAVDPQRQLDLAGQLEDAFSTLFSTAGDAFGVNSPEFVAIFDQVTGGLESLADLTEARGRSVEEINAEIERLTAENEKHLADIDARIQSAQRALSEVGQQTANNTFRASQELQDLFEYIRSEYIRILEERFEQLGEISETGFGSEIEGLEAIDGSLADQLVVLKDQFGELEGIGSGITRIADTVSAIAGGGGSGQPPGSIPGAVGMQHGGVINEFIRGIGRSGRVYEFGERGPEAVIPFGMGNTGGGSRRYDIYIHSDNPGVVQAVTEGLTKNLRKDIADDIRRHGEIGVAVQDATRTGIRH